MSAIEVLPASRPSRQLHDSRPCQAAAPYGELRSGQTSNAMGRPESGSITSTVRPRWPGKFRTGVFFCRGGIMTAHLRNWVWASALEVAREDAMRMLAAVAGGVLLLTCVRAAEPPSE